MAKQYRAVVRRPYSILDTKEDKERGYVEEYTPGFPFKSQADNFAHRRSEETHAYVVSYQEREVTFGEWEDSNGTR